MISRGNNDNDDQSRDTDDNLKAPSQAKPLRSSNPTNLRRVDDEFLAIMQFGAVVGGPDEGGLRRRPHATQEASAGSHGRPRSTPSGHAHHARYRLCQRKLQFRCGFVIDILCCLVYCGLYIVWYFVDTLYGIQKIVVLRCGSVQALFYGHSAQVVSWKMQEETLQSYARESADGKDEEEKDVNIKVKG